MQTSSTFFSTQLLLCVQKIQIESREIKKLTRMHSLAERHHCIIAFNPHRKKCVSNKIVITARSWSHHYLSIWNFFYYSTTLQITLRSVRLLFFPLSSFEIDRQPKKCPIAFLHFCHWGCSYIFYSLAKRKKIGK